jgi:hypothetical protein
MKNANMAIMMAVSKITKVNGGYFSRIIPAIQGKVNPPMLPNAETNPTALP